MVDRYPELTAYINRQVSNFVKDEHYRTKRVTPSLGEFLPLLTVSNLSWKDIAKAYLSENFDRNVLWTLKKYPELETLESDSISWERLNKTFEVLVVRISLK
jgi:hypothetical protein